MPTTGIVGTKNEQLDDRSETNDWLVSFASIRAKTLSSLYGGIIPGLANGHSAGVVSRDKSPKGTVDEPIQDLVDLINLELDPAAYATLSSCSGRFVVFEHAITFTKHETNADQSLHTVLGDDNSLTHSDGVESDVRDAHVYEPNRALQEQEFCQQSSIVKGGKWLLVEHTHFDPNQLVKIFFDEESMIACDSPVSKLRESCDDDNVDSNYCNDNDEIEETEDTFKNDSDDESAVDCTVKFEPALLHVAAATLQHGQALLQLALRVGFRESGLIVTSNRVTVAIRSNSLQLSVPFTRRKAVDDVPTNYGQPQKRKGVTETKTSSLFPPSREYLRALGVNANQRLEQNWKKLKMLYNAIKSSNLYGLPCRQLQQSQLSTISLPSFLSLSLDTTSLPVLNIWGHAAVVISTKPPSVSKASITTDVECSTSPLNFSTGSIKNDTIKSSSSIVVIGGYGHGPFIQSTSSARRSDQIYCLRKSNSLRNFHTNNPCNEIKSSLIWEKVQLEEPRLNVASATEQKIFFHPPYNYVMARLCEWSARVGLSACRINSHSGTNVLAGANDTILLFGGRKSPNQPLNELVLLQLTEVNTSQCGETVSSTTCLTGQFYSPLDVRGIIPSARWGHTLTSLEPSESCTSICDSIFLLFGGSNSTGSCIADPIYTLTIIKEKVMDDTTNSMAIHTTYDSNKHCRCYFLWQQLLLPDSTNFNFSRFYHSAVLIDSDAILIFGGLSTSNDILESIVVDEYYQNEKTKQLAPLVVRRSSQSEETFSNGDTLVSSPYQHHFTLDIVFEKSNLPFCSRFGHSACVIPQFSSTSNIFDSHALVLVSGGVSCLSKCTDENDPVLYCLKVGKQQKGNNFIWTLYLFDDIVLLRDRHQQSTIGPLVHHCCLYSIDPLRSFNSRQCGTIALIGGGVAGFAFGPCYAKSCLLSVHMENNKLMKTNCKSEYRDESLIGIQDKRSANDNIAKFSENCQHPTSLAFVLFVHPKNAKQLKSTLEKSGFMNTIYRMVKVEVVLEEDYIIQTLPHSIDNCLVAVPVNQSCWEIAKMQIENPMTLSAEESWLALILGTGRRQLPYRSGVFARKTYTMFIRTL